MLPVANCLGIYCTCLTCITCRMHINEIRFLTPLGCCGRMNNMCCSRGADVGNGHGAGSECHTRGSTPYLRSTCFGSKLTSETAISLPVENEGTGFMRTSRSACRASNWGLLNFSSAGYNKTAMNRDGSEMEKGWGMEVIWC